MIHYSIHGKGHPLLLIHGFPNDSSAWEPVLAALSQQFWVVLPDLPGAGKSASLKEPLTMEAMATAINDILVKENIAQAVLAGHSMGGYVAMQCAAMFPQKIKGVSLIHSLASADNDEKKEMRRKAILLMKKGEAEKAMFLKGMAGNLFAPDFAQQHPEKVQSIVANGMKLSAVELADFYTAIMNRTDKTSVLPTLDFPVQWIAGNFDNATSMKDALEQCSLAKVNSIHLYKPCGHMSFMEMPERLLADLSSFVEFCFQ